jgi:hypothetical protein
VPINGRGDVAICDDSFKDGSDGHWLPTSCDECLCTRVGFHPDFVALCNRTRLLDMMAMQAFAWIDA